MLHLLKDPYEKVRATSLEYVVTLVEAVKADMISREDAKALLQARISLKEFLLKKNLQDPTELRIQIEMFKKALEKL